jgi:hypothetical protein
MGGGIQGQDEINVFVNIATASAAGGEAKELKGGWRFRVDIASSSPGRVPSPRRVTRPLDVS